MEKVNVFDVADYIVKNVDNITAMKLQKLVYYSQAWSLAWDDEPLFEEDFQAWANGPVCFELYKSHRGLFHLESDLFEGYTNKNIELNDDQKETIDAVLKHYGDRTPHFLSELTHKEDPWKNTRKNLPSGEPSQDVITKESMQLYYGGMIG